MASELPPQGSIIRYPYLWRTQARVGETEGRKERPVCLLLRMSDARSGLSHMLLLAISSQPPSSSQLAIEIPEIERRRGGLSSYPCAWIYVDECNHDIAERSHYFEPSTPILGSFSAPFLRRIAAPILGILRQGHGMIDRTGR